MMTEQELEDARNSIRRLRGYQKGLVPARPDSFQAFVQDELGLKVAPTIQNLINAIQILDRRLTDREASGGGGGGGAPSAPTEGGGDAINGWRRTSDGYIEQWGRCRHADNVTFPKPFAEAVSFISGTCINGTNPDDWVGFTFHPWYLSLTGFQARMTYQARWDAGPPGETFTWYARGR